MTSLFDTARPWKRGTFNICVNPRVAYRGDDNGIRTGYTRGPFGIATKTWVITHLPTGLICCERAKTLREAKEIATALLPLANWDEAQPFNNQTEEARLAIRRLVLGTK